MVDRVATVLETAFKPVSKGLEADLDENLPELYVNVDGVDICLTFAPL